MFFDKIFELATNANAKRICINISSISDMEEFKNKLLKNNLSIDYINALNSYSYGFDAIPVIRDHFKKIPDNYYKFDKNGDL